MLKKNIPHTEPFIGKEELKEISDCIRDKWLSGGPKLKAFQEKIAKLCGVKHAIGVCNGTQALYVGLKILGIGPGDEVIVPDFTFIASANAVVWAGGTPVFVDIDSKTFNIDPSEIEKAITKKTKAIMPVHIYGQAADMSRVMEIAKKHNLYVIEDAAQGIKVSFKGKPVGGFGDVGCMSFYADKVLTTGEGGMVLTNSDELAQKAIILLNQGRTGRGWYIHDYMGYNFRLTDLQAAVGLAQIKKLPEIIRRRNRIEKLYQKYLSKVSGIEFPYVDPRGKRVPWRMIILVKDPKGLSEFLQKEGIKTVRTFYPLHLQPCYNLSGDFPNSLRVYEKILRLPSATALTQGEVKYVCDKIKLYFKNDAKI
jgi:perosamine synthetase